ncbi:MAG TPA: sugar ABC transporter ATP-binding protein [Patescibacteria group bacterium]|nr:sugar ABC transporter ATP-binding protein [Patescibacteria group bacterium]
MRALDDVSLDIYAGEIHGLVGENGSGKSTFAKILAGVYQPDSGEILLDGASVRLPDPLAARRRGVSEIYQEFSLVRSLSVAENVFLGRLPRRGVRVDWPTMRRRAVDLLNGLGIEINPDAMVGSLSVAEQQLVEIAKAVSTDSRLLILDEPTAALNLPEVDRLHDLIRRLAARGTAVVYISHRLREFLGLTDRITVFKDGRLVATGPSQQFDLGGVVRLMLGQELKDHFPKEHHASDEPLLEVRDLVSADGVNGVTFTVHRGEIFGLGGMIGSGRTEIARALFGVDSVVSGTIRLNGTSVRFRSPREAIVAGLGLVTEDRKADGLFFNFTGIPNITVSRMDTLLRGPFLSHGRERRIGREYLGRLRITPAAEWKTADLLSGGNQQKCAIARWVHSGSRLLILDEPTRGIDIGARIEVYRLMNALTSQGVGIVLSSSDYPELLAMSDRVGIVRDGRIVAIEPANRLTDASLIALASGFAA